MGPSCAGYCVVPLHRCCAPLCRRTQWSPKRSKTLRIYNLTVRWLQRSFSCDMRKNTCTLAATPTFVRHARAHVRFTTRVHHSTTLERTHHVSSSMPCSLCPPQTKTRGSKALMAAGTSTTTWCPARPDHGGTVKFVSHKEGGFPLPWLQRQVKGAEYSEANRFGDSSADLFSRVNL